jgi:putative ABC transport system substrate-binding protein
VSDNPVRAGIATSLAKPGKNFTGITFLTDEMAAKRIGLLKEVMPSAKRVAAIFNPLHLDDELTFAKRGADVLGIQLMPYTIYRVADLKTALRNASADRADSLFIIASRLTNFLAGEIAKYGQEQRLPVIAAWREFTASGALLSYGPNRVFEARRLAGYVQRVLSGAKPADLPIEQPVKFELVINAKTANSLGLSLPPSIVTGADELIE